MKKIAFCLSIILLLSGCGKEEMITCSNETNYNGLTSGTKYEITYTNDKVKHVLITYSYNQDTHTDGVGTGTDGTTEDSDKIKNNDIIAGGKVGEVTDDIIGGIYSTILDLSGLKSKHTNQTNNINIEGFTSKVLDNTDNSYKIVYDIDLTKISDTDITKFNVDKDYKTLINNYTNQGLTCK